MFCFQRLEGSKLDHGHEGEEHEEREKKSTERNSGGIRLHDIINRSLSVYAFFRSKMG
jgi:hypothetical protein